MAEIVVTLKAGKGYEAPWLVFKGETVSEVAAQVAEATGLNTEGLTLSELTYNASQVFQRMTTAGTVLGATAIPQEAPAQQPKQEAPAPAPRQETSNIVPGAELSTKIEAAESQEQLADLFYGNKGLFESTPSLMAALDAKAASLT